MSAAPVRIGTRGSALALAQAGMVRDALAAKWPAHDFVLEILKTQGDAWSARPGDPGPPPDKGFFTREFEEALRAGTIDLAVHSLKDLPTEETPGLVLAAIPRRADARDVLVLRAGLSHADLPPDATVATGSSRRASQLRALRPDLRTVPIRGNIDTRLRKLRENPGWAATVLAAAGLERLRPDVSGLAVVPLDYSLMLPAPGQGALALQLREDDRDNRFRAAALDHAPTRAAVTAERAFLQGLGGGCRTPVGAHAAPEGDGLTLRGIAWIGDDPAPRSGAVSGPLESAAALGAALAEEILG